MGGSAVAVLLLAVLTVELHWRSIDIDFLETAPRNIIPVRSLNFECCVFVAVLPSSCLIYRLSYTTFAHDATRNSQPTTMSTNIFVDQQRIPHTVFQLGRCYVLLLTKTDPHSSTNHTKQKCLE